MRNLCHDLVITFEQAGLFDLNQIHFQKTSCIPNIGQPLQLRVTGYVLRVMSYVLRVDELRVAFLTSNICLLIAILTFLSSHISHLPSNISHLTFNISHLTHITLNYFVILITFDQ